MSQMAARFTRVRTTATTTLFAATGDEKKSAGLFVITEYEGSLTYGVPFMAVRKYSRNATLVPSSVGTEAATMVPLGSTTATDSYSGDRAGFLVAEIRRVLDDVGELRHENDVAQTARQIRVNGVCGGGGPLADVRD